MRQSIMHFATKMMWLEDKIKRAVTMLEENKEESIPIFVLLKLYNFMIPI